jgi:hypothetical protein
VPLALDLIARAHAGDQDLKPAHMLVPSEFTFTLKGHPEADTIVITGRSGSSSNFNENAAGSADPTVLAANPAVAFATAAILLAEAGWFGDAMQFTTLTLEAAGGEDAGNTNLKEISALIDAINRLSRSVRQSQRA